MKTTITDHTPAVEKDIMLKANIFLRTMCDTIVDLSTPNTPKKTGRLRFDINRSVLALKGKIIWGKNYAGIQETKQFKNYTTPGTGPHYAENAVQKGIQETSSVARKAGLIA